MKLFTTLALLMGFALAGCATADTGGASDRIWRSSINLPDGGSAQSVMINTDGKLYAVTIERFAGDTFADSDRITVEGNDLDLWDANTMLAYAEAKFGGNFEARLRCSGARTVDGGDGIEGIGAGVDTVLGTPDDTPSDDTRTSRDCNW